MSLVTRRVTLTVLSLAVAGSSLASAPAARALTPGDAQPGGVSIARSFGPAVGNEGASDVLVQPDGRIVLSVINSLDADRRIVRLNADGTLDESFAFGGIWHQPRAGNMTVRALGLQPDGKIVFVGEDMTLPAIVVGRLTASGVPDATFSGDGLYVAQLPAASAPFVTELLVEPSGAISFAGVMATATKGDELLIGRLLADGTDDATFPGSPYTTFGSPVDGDDDQLGGFVRMASGDYVLGASSPASPPMIWRVERNATFFIAANANLPSTLDTPIDVVATDATHVAVLLEGAPIGAGLGYYDVSATPKLVPSADPDGTVTPLPGDVQGGELLRDRSGRYLVAGIGGATNGRQRVVARVRPDGSLDGGFAGSGVRVLSGATDTQWLGLRPQVALGPNGSIFTAHHVDAGVFRTTSLDELVGRMSRHRMSVSAISSSVALGAILPVKLRATNDGPDPSAAGGRVSFTLSEGLRLTSMTGLSCTSDSPQTGTCDIPPLASGASRTITIRVRGASAGAARVSALVQVPVLDDVADDDRAELSLDVASPAAVAAAALGAGAGPRVTLQRIGALRGRVLRCGSTRVPCVAARVRRGVRTAPMFVRVAVTPASSLPAVAARRSVRVLLEQHVAGGSWRSRRSVTLSLPASGRRDAVLPSWWRHARGGWRLRARLEPVAPLGSPVFSAWLRVQVR